MSRPNMFIVYVSDAPKAARVYGDLFGMTPSFETPGFIAFDLGADVQLALWSGAGDGIGSARRTNEVCLCLPGGPEQIDQQYTEWQTKDVTVVEEPHDAVFGRTFVVADADGNLIRVAPVD